jgi:hypothetical protein
MIRHVARKGGAMNETCNIKGCGRKGTRSAEVNVPRDYFGSGIVVDASAQTQIVYLCDTHASALSVGSTDHVSICPRVSDPSVSPEVRARLDAVQPYLEDAWEALGAALREATGLDLSREVRGSLDACERALALVSLERLGG